MAGDFEKRVFGARFFAVYCGVGLQGYQKDGIDF